MNLRTRRGLLMIAIVLSPFLIGLLFTYQLIRVPLPTDMAANLAIDYQEGPRLGPPAGAVPIQGESMVPGEIPVNPVAADEISLQRGEILYGFHCDLCHGVEGRGNGPLAGYFSRTPEDLVGSTASAEFDGSVYLVIMNGYGEMPPLAENLTLRERWDVINYVRTLPASGK